MPFIWEQISWTNVSNIHDYLSIFKEKAKENPVSFMKRDVNVKFLLYMLNEHGVRADQIWKLYLNFFFSIVWLWLAKEL